LQENKGKKENFGTPSPHPSIAARRAAAPPRHRAPAAPGRGPGRAWPSLAAAAAPSRARLARPSTAKREREIWGRAAEHHQAREREREFGKGKENW